MEKPRKKGEVRHKKQQNQQILKSGEAEVRAESAIGKTAAERRSTKKGAAQDKGAEQKKEKQREKGEAEGKRRSRVTKSSRICRH